MNRDFHSLSHTRGKYSRIWFLTSFVRFEVSGATLAMDASATFFIKKLAEGVRLSVPCVRARYPIRLCTSRSRGRMLARTRLATVEVDLKPVFLRTIFFTEAHLAATWALQHSRSSKIIPRYVHWLERFTCWLLIERDKLSSDIERRDEKIMKTVFIALNASLTLPPQSTVASHMVCR